MRSAKWGLDLLKSSGLVSTGCIRSGFEVISTSISPTQASKCFNRRDFAPGSANDGMLGNGGGSGVAKYRETSRAQSAYPARYLLTSGLSKFLCL